MKRPRQKRQLNEGGEPKPNKRQKRQLKEGDEPKPNQPDAHLTNTTEATNRKGESCGFHFETHEYDNLDDAIAHAERLESPKPSTWLY